MEAINKMDYPIPEEKMIIPENEQKEQFFIA
jgi:hypothetical protein